MGRRIYIEISLIEASRMEEAVELADLVFRSQDPEKKSFGKSHPQAFSTALNQSYGIYEDGRLVSFVGLVPSVIRIDPAQIHCFSVGGVCTHPDYRGRGYASRLIETVLRHVNDSDASLLIVSGNRSLYTRTYCFPYGAVKECRIDAQSIPGMLERISRSPDLSIREMMSTDWFGIHHLSKSKSVSFERSIWDLALLLEAEPTGAISKLRHKVLIAEQKGVIQAFVVVGVPYSATSSNPCVLEWAGDATAITSLLADAVQRYDLDELNMCIPWHEVDLIRLLALENSYVPNSGTIRIMDSERLMKQLMPYLLTIDEKLASRIKTSMLSDGTTLLKIDSDYTNLDRRAITSLILDVNTDYNTKKPIGHLLSKLFPIPFPNIRGLNFV